MIECIHLGDSLSGRVVVAATNDFARIQFGLAADLDDEFAERADRETNRKYGASGGVKYIPQGRGG